MHYLQQQKYLSEEAPDIWSKSRITSGLNRDILLVAVAVAVAVVVVVVVVVVAAVVAVAVAVAVAV